MHITPHTTHTSTQILTSIKVYVILLLSLLLVSCGGGGGGGPVKEFTGSTESTIFLNVTKGPVTNASCMLTDATGKNTTQPNKTDSTGHSENTATITAGALIVACSDGSYTDEATGSVIDAPTMHALGYHSGNNFSATISPLSEIVYQRTIALTKNVASLTATEIGNEHQKIATLFGLEGVDILKTVPTPLVGTGAATAVSKDVAADKFAIVLAGLSQLFFENYGTATEEVAQGIRALATDLADGTFDAKDDLRTAIETFINNKYPNSPDYKEIASDLTQAIGSATATVTPVAAPVLSITTDTQVSYTVDASITPLVFDSTAGKITECSISALPPGLQLNGTPLLSTPATSSGTCELTGTPTTASSSTEYTITVGNIRATDSATIDITVNKGTQAPLTTPIPTIITFGVGQLTVSAQGGSGNGKTITATSSSNPNVAEVSEDGNVVIKGASTTTITITKAGDDNYLPIDTTYTLTVLEPNVATITMRVGTNTSTMQIANPTPGEYNVYVSPYPNCDTTDISGQTCNNTEIIPAYQTAEFTATDLRLSGSPTFGVLQTTSNKRGEFSILLDKFSRRSNHQVVEMNGDLYLIGGQENFDSSSYKNDVWKSTDNGQNWLEILPHNTNVTNNTQFSPRADHQVVVKDGDMYLIGGTDGSNRFNDVWKSSNGETWQLVEPDENNPNPIFSARFAHQVVVLGGDMYLIGGTNGSGRFNDVWKSSDGANWALVEPDENNSNPIFSARYDHQVVVNGGDMYLIGGRETVSSYKNDVWKSSDGANWEQVPKPTDSSLIFSTRFAHQVVVLGGDMYLIGGFDRSPDSGATERFRSDVWKSSDGQNWTKITESKFSGRQSHQVVVKGEDMYVLGGFNGYTFFNDVWKSSDGENWTQISIRAEFSQRTSHQVIEMNGTIYLIGGVNEGTSEYKNDVWSSTDGTHWIEVSPQNNNPADTKFSPRGNHRVAVIDGTMYVIGGNSGKRLNDVWSSTDGKTWNQVLAYNDPPQSSQFIPRLDHQVAVIDNTLYLIGGRDNSERLNDVWKSDDNGQTWQPVESDENNPIFSARDNHQVVVIDNTMYLIGGFDGSKRLNDVWSSTDGKTWNQVLAHNDTPQSSQFTPRQRHQVVVIGDDTNATMYLIGGGSNTNAYESDIWKSEDKGVTWDNVTENADFVGRQFHQAVVKDDTMYVIGGSDKDNKFNDVWSSTDVKNWFLNLHVNIFLDSIE